MILLYDIYIYWQILIYKRKTLYGFHIQYIYLNDLFLDSEVWSLKSELWNISDFRNHISSFRRLSTLLKYTYYNEMHMLDKIDIIWNLTHPLNISQPNLTPAHGLKYYLPQSKKIVPSLLIIYLHSYMIYTISFNVLTFSSFNRSR